MVDVIEFHSCNRMVSAGMIDPECRHLVFMPYVVEFLGQLVGPYRKKIILVFHRVSNSKAQKKC